MNENLLNIILLCIPVLGAVITSFVIPFLKANIDAKRLEEIMKWISKAVRAAEVLFDVPQSGEKKREYVIDFIDKTFNSKKEMITKKQIRILLEAAWKEMNEGTGGDGSPATE